MNDKGNNPTMLIISPLLSISSHPVLSGCSYSTHVFLITCYLLERPVSPLQSVDDSETSLLQNGCWHHARERLEHSWQYTVHSPNLTRPSHPYSWQCMASLMVIFSLSQVTCSQALHICLCFCVFVCISPRSSHVLWVCACLVFVLEGKIASLLNAANTHLPQCAYNTQTQSAICLTGYQPPPAVCPTALY